MWGLRAAVNFTGHNGTVKENQKPFFIWRKDEEIKEAHHQTAHRLFQNVKVGGGIIKEAHMKRPTYLFPNSNAIKVGFKSYFIAPSQPKIKLNK